jgi:hypothetical protein
MVVMATHSSPVPSLPISMSLITIICVGIVITLNHYNMQTSSARGLQEKICEKEEKRLGTSVLP